MLLRPSGALGEAAGFLYLQYHSSGEMPEISPLPPGFLTVISMSNSRSFSTEKSMVQSW